MVKPGILDDFVAALKKEAKFVNVTFDGKKTNSSLTEIYLNVDLFGCELEPTLQGQIFIDITSSSKYYLFRKNLKKKKIRYWQLRTLIKGILSLKTFQALIHLLSKRKRE